MKPIKTPASAQADQTRQTASTHIAPIQQVAAESMFADNRPEMVAQRQRLTMMNNSPQIQQQKTRQNGINSSSHTLAQLKQHNAVFGSAIQRQEAEIESIQGQFDTTQRQEQAATKPNNTGLPDQLKSGIESLSGLAMDHVKVHYNSSQPAQLNALAYAQGSDIHVAPGQEQHLPHEAWHVVQQAQGRVKPTMQMKEGVPVNDDAGLEHEADVMGAKALQRMSDGDQVLNNMAPFAPTAIQRVALAATANLGWDAAGAETWAGNASNPAPIGPNLNSLVAANVLTAANAAAGFVSGHVIAAAMGGVNAIGNIVGWDDTAHETPQTAFEQAIYHGGAALHGFGALAAPEASETGTVTVAANIGGPAAVTTVRDAWVTALSTHVFNNVATLQGNGGLTRNPAIPLAAPVVAPTQAAMTNAFNINLGGGHAVEYVARIPDAYTISYAPTNGGHSNAASRTSQLAQVSLPAVAFNAGSTPQEQFDAMRGNNPTLRFGQWILSAV